MGDTEQDAKEDGRDKGLGTTFKSTLCGHTSTSEALSSQSKSCFFFFFYEGISFLPWEALKFGRIAYKKL